MKKLIIFIVIIFAVGCGSFYFYKNTQVIAQEDAGVHGGGGMHQAMPVITATVESKPVYIWKNFSGRLSAVDYVEVRPQVSGKIQEIHFKDGQRVNKDDVIITIDPRPYEAAANQAKAAVKSAENSSSLASKEARRAETLAKTSAVSQKILDERINNERVARAAVEEAKAALEQTQINLDYASVKAPISGRLSRIEITEGNLVQAATAPILTTIVSDEGIYADFDVDEQTYLSHIRQMAKTQQDEAKIPVRIQIGENGQNDGYEGFIYSFDNRIDPASGTIRARALIPNKDDSLLPGMFARIDVGSAQAEDRIVITDKAIGTDQDRKFVYIIDENGQTAYREVHLGSSIDGGHVITDGLKEGDVIITEGIVKIRPGMPVTPKTDEQAAHESL
jgi:multidrug efflux system membrane fusion protein